MREGGTTLRRSWRRYTPRLSDIHVVTVLLYVACRGVKMCCWVHSIGPPTCQHHHTFKPVIKGVVFYLRELYIQDNPHITELGVLSIVNLLVK